MSVSKQEFERLDSDVKSSYASIAEALFRLETQVGDISGRFDKLEEKFDRMDRRLTHIADDLAHTRLNFGARFDVLTGQLRLMDQGQFRSEERLCEVERRVYVLEEKAR
jgi:peptidoglycan hydrolase CwlO-like protein